MWRKISNSRYQIQHRVHFLFCYSRWEGVCGPDWLRSALVSRLPNHSLPWWRSQCGYGTLLILKIREKYAHMMTCTYFVVPSPKVLDTVVHVCNSSYFTRCKRCWVASNFGPVMLRSQYINLLRTLTKLSADDEDLYDIWFGTLKLPTLYIIRLHS
jgi:hypothetical protein